VRRSSIFCGAGRQRRLAALLYQALDDNAGNPGLVEVVPSLLARSLASLRSVGGLRYPRSRPIAPAAA
jgi:hypothetical protein